MTNLFNNPDRWEPWTDKGLNEYDDRYISPFGLFIPRADGAEIHYTESSFHNQWDEVAFWDDRIIGRIVDYNENDTLAFEVDFLNTTSWGSDNFIEVIVLYSLPGIKSRTGVFKRLNVGDSAKIDLGRIGALIPEGQRQTPIEIIFNFTGEAFEFEWKIRPVASHGNIPVLVFPQSQTDWSDRGMDIPDGWSQSPYPHLQVLDETERVKVIDLLPSSVEINDQNTYLVYLQVDFTRMFPSHMAGGTSGEVSTRLLRGDGTAPDKEHVGLVSARHFQSNFELRGLLLVGMLDTTDFAGNGLKLEIDGGELYNYDREPGSKLDVDIIGYEPAAYVEITQEVHEYPGLLFTPTSAGRDGQTSIVGDFRGTWEASSAVQDLPHELSLGQVSPRPVKIFGGSAYNAIEFTNPASREITVVMEVYLFDQLARAIGAIYFAATAAASSTVKIVVDINRIKEHRSEAMYFKTSRLTIHALGSTSSVSLSNANISESSWSAMGESDEFVTRPNLVSEGASILYFEPDQFEDDAENSPPSGWNGAEYSYTLTKQVNEIDETTGLSMTGGVPIEDRIRVTNAREIYHTPMLHNRGSSLIYVVGNDWNPIPPGTYTQIGGGDMATYNGPTEFNIRSSDGKDIDAKLYLNADFIPQTEIEVDKNLLRSNVLLSRYSIDESTFQQLHTEWTIPGRTVSSGHYPAQYFDENEKSFVFTGEGYGGGLYLTFDRINARPEYGKSLFSGDVSLEGPSDYINNYVAFRITNRSDVNQIMYGFTAFNRYQLRDSFHLDVDNGLMPGESRIVVTDTRYGTEDGYQVGDGTLYFFVGGHLGDGLPETSEHDVLIETQWDPVPLHANMFANPHLWDFSYYTIYWDEIRYSFQTNWDPQTMSTTMHLQSSDMINSYMGFYSNVYIDPKEDAGVIAGMPEYFYPDNFYAKVRFTNISTEHSVLIEIRAGGEVDGESIDFEENVVLAPSEQFVFDKSSDELGDFPKGGRLTFKGLDAALEHDRTLPVDLFIETEWDDSLPEVAPNLLSNPELFSNSSVLLPSWNEESRSYEFISGGGSFYLHSNQASRGEHAPVDNPHIRARITNRGPINTLNLNVTPDSGYSSFSLPPGRRQIIDYNDWFNSFTLSGNVYGSDGYSLDVLVETEFEMDTLAENLLENPFIFGASTAESPQMSSWDQDNHRYVFSNQGSVVYFQVNTAEAALNAQGYLLPDNPYVKFRVTNQATEGGLYVNTPNGRDVVEPGERMVFEFPDWDQFSLDFSLVNYSSYDDLALMVETRWDEDSDGRVPVPNLFQNPSLFTGTDLEAAWDGVASYLIRRPVAGGFTMVFDAGTAIEDPTVIPANNFIRGRLTNQSGHPITIRLSYTDPAGQVTVEDIGPLPVGERYVMAAPAWGQELSLDIQGTDQFDLLLETDWTEEEEEPPLEGDDTYSLKGFISFGALAYNEPHQVAPVGEISNLARSYSRDQQLYSKGSATVPSTAVNLSVFSSREIATGVHVTLSQTHLDLLVELGLWSYTQALGKVFNDDPDSYRLPMLQFFSNQVSHLYVGPMVRDLVKDIWLPSTIVFYLHNGEERSKVQLWFADEAFREQYDEFELMFISPMDRLDDFYRTPAAVRSEVSRRSLSELHQLVRQRAGNSPYTVLRTEDFDYYPPGAPEERFPTSWTIIVWGSPRDHFDVIRQELSDWILENSDRDREDWVQILPDIFTSTEFVISPLWTSYAIPNKSEGSGMYSPVVPMPYGLEVVGKTAVGDDYTSESIESNTSVLNTTYKSLALMVTGSPKNRDRLIHFSRAYRDYLAVPTASMDFDRMQPATRGFVEVLHMLLFVAESMTEYSPLPEGVTRIWRIGDQGDRILYATARYGNIQYLVVSKHSMNRLFPPRYISPLQLTVGGVEGETRLPHMGENTYEVELVALGGQGPYQYTLLEGTGTNWFPLTHISVDLESGILSAAKSNGGTADLVFPVQVVDSDGRSEVVHFELHIVG